MHGADFDITMLKRRFDRVPERILDTQIAARLCGARQFGLANLIQQEFSLTLSKQSQRANWGKRPLLEKMVEYALNDVRYILPLADIYGERLKELGRYEWFLESCSDARHVVMARPPRDAEEAWRISGSGKLRPMAMHFLRAVWHWRDGEAERLDRPAFKVISNEELIKFAEKMATGEFPALPERFHSSAVRRFQKALREANAQPQDQWPRRRQGIRTMRNHAADKRMEEYRAHRDKVALELDLDPALIASRGVLETLAHHPEKAPELLLNWQRQLMRIIS
jgi:ribonuclease D